MNLRTSFLQRLVRWRYLFIVNAFLIAALGWALGREVVRSRAIDAEIQTLQTQVDTLSARNQEIARIQSALQTQSYIEREARLKLGLKKPGESVVVVREEGGGRREEGETTEDPNDPLGLVLDGEPSGEPVANPTKWWYYFFDKISFNKLVKL